MKIIFMGTPDFASGALRALAQAGHEIVAVYSQPPRRAGRGKALTPTPVHVAAEAMGIPVYTPVSLKSENEQAAFAALGADVAVVAAYGLILPQAVLDAPKHGCINVHASLLPRWRGAAPIQRAILAGDAETGVTIMQMEAGLDTGPMLAKVVVPIGDYISAAGLTDILSVHGGELLVQVLANLSAYPPVPQPEEGFSYANKIDKSEARLDFTQSAVDVVRQVRAFHPTAFFEVNGERVRVLEAVPLTEHPNSFHFDFPSTPGLVLGDQLAVGCETGAIRPTFVQRAGGRPLDTLEFLRGFPIPAGTKLG